MPGNNNNGLYGSNTSHETVNVLKERNGDRNHHPAPCVDLSFLPRDAMLARPDYGIEILGKCPRPTTSKGLTKDGCKNFEHTLANQSLTFLCIVSTKLSIFVQKHQFYVLRIDFIAGILYLAT